MTTTHGVGNVTFLDMVRDTVNTHGIRWAVHYYYARMPAWEARFWLRNATR